MLSFAKRLSVLVITLVFIIAPNASAAGIKFSSNKISDRHPCQNASITYTAKVVKSNGHALSGATVKIKVYYKTKTTSYKASKTNSSGKSSKKFKIGMATANRKVTIRSTATKSCHTAKGSTWFKPKKC